MDEVNCPEAEENGGDFGSCGVRSLKWPIVEVPYSERTSSTCTECQFPEPLYRKQSQIELWAAMVEPDSESKGEQVREEKRKIFGWTWGRKQTRSE